MFRYGSQDAAYRRETERFMAERLPLAVLLYMVSFGASGIFEYLLYPEHWHSYLLCYAAESLPLLVVLAARRPLERRGWLLPASVLVWTVVVVVVHGYQSVAKTVPTELTVLASICVMTGSALLLPWGVRGQLLPVAAAVVGVSAQLVFNPPTAVPAPYLFFVELAGAIIALFGAHYFDSHRFALFREAAEREEQSSISHSLVAIAREINESLDGDDELDRIASVIAVAVHADWCAIVARNPSEDRFVVAGSSGPIPEALASLGGIEFSVGAFPLVDRVLAERNVVLTDRTADAANAALMRRSGTRSLMGAALLRRDAVVGVLLAGAQGRPGYFSERGRELFGSVAQHTAIAVGNVRLLEALRRANNLKTEFLSTMSHELRTPLNVVIGYADLLRDDAFGPVSGDQRDVLGRMRDNAHALLELINATLEVNRIEAGHSSVQLQEVALSTLLAELQRETEQMPRAPGVRLLWEVPRGSEEIRTDPVKLKIVVRNLVGNALKFTRTGSVTVAVDLDLLSRQLGIEVRDTGIGIDSEQLPRIFDMFHQVPGDVSSGGVGLGLYIVRRFVDLLGGRISASSSPGSGSVFHVSLPAGTRSTPTLEMPPRQASA